MEKEEPVAAEAPKEEPLVIEPTQKAADDDDADERPAKGSHPSSRGRGGRLRGIEEELRREREEGSKYRTEMQRTIAELQARIEGMKAPPKREESQQDEEAPIKQELQQLVLRAREATSKEEADILTRRYYELAERLNETRLNKKLEALKSDLEKRFQERNQGQQRNRAMEMVEDEFPELAKDKEGLQAAQAYFDYQVRVEGRQPSLALYREAAAAAASKRGYGPPSEPTRDRQRMGSVPSSSRDRPRRSNGTFVANDPASKAIASRGMEAIRRYGGTEDDFLSALNKE